MILELSDDAAEYGRQALRAFEAAGGDLLLQRAEADPSSREALVAPVLAELGAWELEARTDADAREAAAAPVPQRGLLGTAVSAGGKTLPPRRSRRRRPHRRRRRGAGRGRGRPVNAWAAVTLDGVRSTAAPGGATGPAFTAALHLTEVDGAGADDVALGLVLPIWTLLGMLDRAIELTIAHIALREQFGQPLSAFQGVQFQLTDAEVERAGWTSWPPTRCGAWTPTTRWRCAWRRSRPPRWCSGCATNCTARSVSATRPHCPGCRATASRCAGCRSGCRPPAQLTRRIGRRGLTGLFS